MHKKDMHVNSFSGNFKGQCCHFPCTYIGSGKEDECWMAEAKDFHQPVYQEEGTVSESIANSSGS